MAIFQSGSTGCAYACLHEGTDLQDYVNGYLLKKVPFNIG